MICRQFILGLLLVVVSSGVALGQVASSPQTIQIDEIGKTGSDDRGGRLDSLFYHLKDTTTSYGVIVLYCGKICQYGELESHIRGILIKAKNREFDTAKLTIISGGYRETFTTELWVVPQGGTLPEIKSKISIKDVRFTKTVNFLVTPYDCCDNADDTWKEYKKAEDKKK